MKFYLLGTVFVLLFLSGCLNLCNQPPVIINNCTAQPQVVCPQENTSQQNTTPTQPLTSQAPTYLLMNTPANYSSPSIPAKKYIDNIRILDLGTYEAPLGRALVARKDYEIIAENDKPFKGYVQFTIYVDNESTDSFNATCPEYCASPTMYSVPISITDGDYKEIKVIATDGAGLTGESMVYTYVRSESEATYLAETCVLSANVADVCGEIDSGEYTFSGSTISDGWANDANPVPYNLDNNYSGLCDEINSGGGLGTGFFAKTRCRFRHRFCASFAPVPDAKACTCDCTASIKEFTVTTEINIDFPSWTGYGSGTTCEKEHWDEFLQNTKTHEEGHALRCQDTKNKIPAGVFPLTGKATKATCQAACDAAFTNLDESVKAQIRNEVTSLTAEQTLYDDTTGHGATQGAILDCWAC